MSKNLFRLRGQTITGKHQLQTTAAHLVPEHGGADPGKQRGANFRLHLSALQHRRGAGDLNTRAKRANDIDIDRRHRA